jgi:hypothetical protein
MAMASERTVWAEGLGYTDEQVEALTLISDEAKTRGFEGALPPGDPTGWACALDAAELPDLAQRVRDLGDW